MLLKEIIPESVMQDLTAYFTNLIPDVKYKVYSALITQSNDGIPTAVVLENTIGSISFSRTNNGDYLVESDDLFVIESTFATIGSPCYKTGQPGFATIELDPNDASKIRILTSNGTIDQDDYLLSTPLEIRVYNR